MISVSSSEFSHRGRLHSGTAKPLCVHAYSLTSLWAHPCSCCSCKVFLQPLILHYLSTSAWDRRALAQLPRGSWYIKSETLTDRCGAACSCPQWVVSVEAETLSSPGIVCLRHNGKPLGKEGCDPVSLGLWQLGKAPCLPSFIPLMPAARTGLFPSDVAHFIYHLYYHPRIEKENKNIT